VLGISIMLMQTLDDSHETWTGFEGTEWGNEYGANPCFSEYMSAHMQASNSWWDPSMSSMPTMDQSFCPYGQGQDFESTFGDWSGYEGAEDWSLRAPKFPPPNAPAPDLAEGMAMLQHAAALQSQAQALMFAHGTCLRPEALIHKETKGPKQKAVKPPGKLPPGLEAAQPRTVDLPVGLLLDEMDRPRPLGLASMMEASSSEIKEPLQRSVTPATTAPPTPASSLSECEATSMSFSPGSLPAPAAGAPGSDRIAVEPPSPPDLGSGYSLFGGTAPWHSLQLGATTQPQHQQKSEDPSIPAKMLGTHLAPIGPAKVRLDDLLGKEDVICKPGSPAGAPPGLFAPGPLLAPPGLALEDSVLGYKTPKRPPGLELAPVAELPEEPLPTPSAISPSGPMPEDKALESVTVERCEVDGVTLTRAVWRIVQLRGRLKTSLGKPVVSPPFNIESLGDLRLMVTPDAKGTLEGMRGKSKQSHFAKMLSQGPLECTLKVKVPTTTTPVVKFYLTVGANCRQGPFTCDFMQHTVHGCNDFNCDWLKQVDDEGCLRVGLEIVEISTDDDRPA